MVNPRDIYKYHCRCHPGDQEERVFKNQERLRQEILEQEKVLVKGTQMKKYLARVDFENPADAFWFNFRERIAGLKLQHICPKILECIVEVGDDGPWVVTEEQRALIESTPGFVDGPQHAPAALIFEEIE